MELKNFLNEFEYDWAVFPCLLYTSQLKMPTIMFGLMTIIFCVVYCVAACILIYRLAPKTFRIRA